MINFKYKKPTILQTGLYFYFAFIMLTFDRNRTVHLFLKIYLNRDNFVFKILSSNYCS